jgi:SPP1 family predicted phage head-tail adaptor
VGLLMGAAALRNTRITIQNKTVSRSAMGDETEVWSDLATVWAERRDVRGNEFYAAQSLLEQGDVMFRIVYLEGITEESRVSCDSRIFDIVRPPLRAGNRRRELELYCRSGVRDGR